MSELESLLSDIQTLTPFIVGVVAMIGLVVGIAPSSFPLITVAASLAAGGEAAELTEGRMTGLRLAVGFVLGIATIDTVLGIMFGAVGFGVMRVLAGMLFLVYAVLALVLVISGLALLRLIHIPIPVLSPKAGSAHSFVGSYLIGLPFGLSSCPACTPLLLPVVAAAASTADPVMGGVLMLTFGLARGIPIAAIAAIAGAIPRLRRTRRFIRWIEHLSGLLLLLAAMYFAYQGAVYAGWLRPLS